MSLSHFAHLQLRFDERPVRDQLGVLLKGSIIRNPELVKTSEAWEVIPPPKSVWLLLPALVLLGLVLTLTPVVAAIGGWKLMSWGAWWVAVAVLWLLVMPLLLGAGIMVLSRLPSQRPVLRVEIESGCLTRAGLEEPIDRGVLVELVELSAWTEWLGAWRQFLQWSAVVRDDEQYVVVPLLTVVDPTVEEVRLVGQLCSQFDCPLTQIDEGPVPAVAGAPEEP